VGRIDTDRYVTVDDTRAVGGLCEHKCSSSAHFTFIWEKCWLVKRTGFRYWSTTTKSPKTQIYWTSWSWNCKESM